MHISLDAALQRQPLLSTVGDKLLPSFPGAAAAYSLRSLNGDANDVVEVRRDGDNTEKTFTAEGVSLELEDWVNGKLETTPPCDVATSAAAYSLRKVRSSYAGDAIRIRRTTDNVEVNVAFDANGEVSTSSSITNATESPDRGDTTATTLGGFLTESAGMVKDAEDGSLSGFSTSDFVSSSSISITSTNPISGNKSYLMSQTGTSGAVGYPRLNVPRSSGYVFELNTEYSIKFKAKLISGTASIIGIRFGQSGSGANATPSTLALTLGEVAEYTGIIDATSIGGSSIFNIQFDGTDGDFEVLIDDIEISTVENDATVQTWYDQSGNGNDATQDTAGSQPKIAESGSLLGELEFDGTNDFLATSSAYPTGTNLSAFIVADSTGNNQRILDTRGTGAGGTVRGWQIKFSNTQDGSSIDDGTAHLLTQGYTRSGQNLCTTIASQTKLEDYTNGVLSGSDTGSIGSFDSGNPLYIGANANGQNAQIFNGAISEIVLYPSDQSDNRFKIESNINNHYGLYTASQNGFVETWYDQSGNGNHAVQDSQNYQPKIVDNGSLATSNGKPSLKLAQSSFKVVGFELYADSYSYFAACAPDLSQDYGNQSLLHYLGGSGVGGNYVQFRYSNNGQFLWYTGTGGTSVNKNSFGQINHPLFVVSGTAVGDGGVANGYKNGELLGTGATSPNEQTIDLSLFAYAGAAGDDFVGFCPEIIFYTSDQSANRTGIESNMADEYGITLP